MEPRTVSAGHGWSWLTEGFLLFRRSPGVWLALIFILFAATQVLRFIPILGVVFVLLMPVFIVGLMEGCRALERGEPLQIAHLGQGFRRHAAQLVTLGGISLVGNLIVMMIMFEVGGDAMSTIAKGISQGAGTTPSPAEINAALPAVGRAMFIGSLLSLPLLMALWYSPLLVHFHDAPTLDALKSSLVACVKNALPMLVYGGVIFVALYIAMRIVMPLGRFDLALWLLAPVVLPSLYASYKDIYLAGITREPAPSE